MNFQRERELTGPVARWLASVGLNVRREFATPWGICDLVGYSFNPERMRTRISNRQTRPIGPLFRVELLARIPDLEKNRGVSVERLQKEFGGLCSPERVRAEIEKLVRTRFVVRTRRGTLLSRNGWHPLHDRLIAVELKMSRVREALHQARCNLDFADESYVGLPKAVAERLPATSVVGEFRESGVGVVSIAPHRCEIVLPALREHRSDPCLQMHVVERLWKAHAKGS